MRDLDLGCHSWLLYRCWCVVRCSGRWPLQVFGHDVMPVTMDTCPLCGQVDASVSHILADCPGALNKYSVLTRSASVPYRSNLRLLWSVLFREPSSLEVRRFHILFVGGCVSQAVGTAMLIFVLRSQPLTSLSKYAATRSFGVIGACCLLERHMQIVAPYLGTGT